MAGNLGVCFGLFLIWHIVQLGTDGSQEVALHLVKSAGKRNQAVAVFRARNQGLQCRRRNIMVGYSKRKRVSEEVTVLPSENEVSHKRLLDYQK